MKRRYVLTQGAELSLNGVGNVVVGENGLEVELTKGGMGWYISVDGIGYRGPNAQVLRGRYPINGSTANFIMRHGREAR